jgi:ketosteroid isomerase-like protein
MAALVSVIVIGLSTEHAMTKDNQKTQPGGSEFIAVEQAINNCLGWAVEKDFDLFFQTISDDSDFVSVTPYDRVKFGVEAVKSDTGFWASPDFKAIRHELHDLKVMFSKSGDVAWFYCRCDDINEWKGQPANWENVRWTGVLEKRDGRWRIVQQHFSFPKRN